MGGTLAAAVTGGPSAYNVAVTGMTGTGLVAVNVPAGAATDAAGNATPGGVAAFTMFDTAQPSVTINKAAGQADPTSSPPILFTIVFSENVTGFIASDVSFAGTTAGPVTGTLTGSGPTYTLTVVGMTTDGNVVASVPASVATDMVGNLNTASTSTDNVVAFTAVAGTVAAPNIFWASAVNIHNPTILLEGTVLIGDTIRFQFATVSDFSSVIHDVSNTIDAAELSAQLATFDIPVSLIDAFWYARARIERPTVGNSNWSNVETHDIVPFDLSSVDWFNAVIAAGGTVSATQKQRVDSLIMGLKADGNWDKLDRLWLYVGESVVQQARIDIRKLSTHTVLGTPTLAANGYTGNGINSAIITNFIFNAPGNAWGQFGASMGFYLKTLTPDGIIFAQHGASTELFFIQPLATSTGDILATIQGASLRAGDGVVPDPRGLIHYSAKAGQDALYLKGAQKAVGPGWISVLFNGDTITVLCRTASPDGTPFDGFTTATVAAVFFGGFFNVSEAGNLNVRIQNYMNAWGVAE